MRRRAATHDQWRGVSSEGPQEVSKRTAALLHRRSRALLRSLVAPYRRRLVAGVVLIVLSTLADLATPWLIGRTIDVGLKPFIGQEGFPRPLSTLLVAVLLTMLAEAVTLRAFVELVGTFTQDVLRDLRTRVFDHFQKLSLSFYERYTSGRVIARLTSDVDSITELLQTGLNDLVSNILGLAGIAIAMLVLDVPLAVATLLVIPFVLLLSAWFRRNAQRVYRRVRRTVALVIVHFVESLGGVRAVQAYRREQRNDEIMGDVNGQYSTANADSIRLLAIYAPGLGFLGRVATVIVLAFGGYRVLEGQLTIGVLVTFVIYVRRFFEPLQDLSQVYNLLQASGAALENLSGVLEEEPSVPEPARPVTPSPLSGRITLEDVSFAYRSTPVLEHLSLEIPAGQTVALVGRTGAGKTTVARLVARFWDPNEGRVLLDGVDLRDIPDAFLRRAIAMVTQESYLFSGSVADNIALGRPEATRDEIVAAAEALGAREFIEALPDGFDTDVKRRGGRLSSGQRQLVSFARAFLADPAVLILDEATSSLDIPSERLVQHALRTLLTDRTAIIIAHRLSTVEIADRVIVLDAGVVVEDGAPEELRIRDGRYAALHDAWVRSLA